MASPPKSWAKLTMYDRLTQRISHSKVPHTANVLRQARPFVVTDRAAERLREAMGLYPELVAENSEFAIPPFETMWVEFPSRIALGHERLSGTKMDPTADMTVGYLFQGKAVTVFSEGEDMLPVALPVVYLLHQPMSLATQQQVADWFKVSRIGIDPFLWGHTLHDTLDMEHRRMLRDRHTLNLGWLTERSVSDRLRHDVYRGSAGELRNILAVLLMINQPAKIIQMRAVPRERGLVKGKVIPYWGHSLIDIDLDRKRKVNLLARPKRGMSNWHVRWHEVRGHFVHRKAVSSHAHEWLPDPYRERRWYCAVTGCEATRTWREYPNGHGSASVGYAEQVRRIKTKEDA